MTRPPVHFERLLEAIESSTAPLICLRGLPGSGRRQFLEAVVASGHGQWVEPALGRDAGSLASYLESLGAARNLLLFERVPQLPEGWQPTTASATKLLFPSEILAESEPRSRHDPQRQEIGLHQLLLARAEMEALWQRHGLEITESAERLFELTRGWLRPLELAAFAQVGTKGAADLTSCPGMQPFLRHRVAPLLGAAAIEELSLASEAANRDDSASAHGVRTELIACGLLVGSERDSLTPAIPLLAALKPPPRHLEVVEHSWELRLLGSPELLRCTRAGAVPVKVPFKRLLELLALLACSPDFSATREVVLDRLWGPDHRRRGLRNLHPTVSHLRRLLGGSADGPLLLEGGVYRLASPSLFRVDVSLFLRGCAPAAAIDAVELAWHEYRGEFMEGFDEGWIVEQREELRERYMDMLDGLGSRYATLGRLEDAEDAFRTLLSQDPLQEHVYLEVMRLYRRRGRRDLVRRLYERMSRTLLGELGIGPLESTKAEYEELMQ